MLVTMDIQIPIYVQQNIFVELGLAQLPAEQKEAMLHKMNELVHKRVMIRVLDELPDDTKEKMSQAETGSEEEEMNALLQEVPNLADILLDEVAAVRGLLHASAVAIEAV